MFNFIIQLTPFLSIEVNELLIYIKEKTGIYLSFPFSIEFYFTYPLTQMAIQFFQRRYDSFDVFINFRIGQGAFGTAEGQAVR